MHSCQELLFDLVLKVLNHRGKPEKLTGVHLQVIRENQKVLKLYGKIPDCRLFACDQGQGTGGGSVFITDFQGGVREVGKREGGVEGECGKREGV